MLSHIVRDAIRYLLVGLVAAWISSIVVRGRIVRLRGCLPYLVFGISGALGGGYLVHAFGLSEVAAVAAAAAGAIAFLVFLQFARNA
jgi:uncharacterized membrane protein YeaQ/YmgE (transglycosylase-associated protein family)